MGILTKSYKIEERAEMKKIIFITVFLLPLASHAEYECDFNIVNTVVKKFNKEGKSKVHRCLHIQSMERVVTVVEKSGDLGALSLYVFSEKDLTENSIPNSYIDSFAIDGMKDVASSGLGLNVDSGISFYQREEESEGVIVIQYKNENDFNDVSLIRLTADGEMKNFNLHGLDTDRLAIAQTENMDLFVFKVAESETFDVVSSENKVVIGSGKALHGRQEIFLGGQRMPAGSSYEPKK